jgi:hypothetical protein
MRRKRSRSSSHSSNALNLTFIAYAYAQHGPVVQKRRLARSPGVADLKRSAEAMHDWTLDAQEVSAGHYIVCLKRSTGEKIERDGLEDVVSQALHEAFLLDRRKGVIPGDSAFVLTRATKKSWKWEYFEQVFGSWSGVSKIGAWRVDYDGKDFIVMVRTTDALSPKIPWQGRVQSLEEPEGKKYFDALLYTY